MAKTKIEMIIETEQEKEQIKEQQSSQDRLGNVFIPRELFMIKNITKREMDLYLVLLTNANHAVSTAIHPTTGAATVVERGQLITSVGTLMEHPMLSDNYRTDTQVKYDLDRLQKRGYIKKKQVRKMAGYGSLITINSYDAITSCNGQLPRGFVDGELVDYKPAPKAKKKPVDLTPDPVVESPADMPVSEFLETPDGYWVKDGDDGQWYKDAQGAWHRVGEDRLLDAWYAAGLIEWDDPLPIDPETGEILDVIPRIIPDDVAYHTVTLDLIPDEQIQQEVGGGHYDS